MTTDLVLRFAPDQETLAKAGPPGVIAQRVSHEQVPGPPPQGHGPMIQDRFANGQPAILARVLIPGLMVNAYAGIQSSS